jgi:hypothetical protein
MALAGKQIPARYSTRELIDWLNGLDVSAGGGGGVGATGATGPRGATGATGVAFGAIDGGFSGDVMISIGVDGGGA